MKLPRERITSREGINAARSPEEIVQMIRAVDPEDWGRGTLGQCVDVLLYEDANLVSKLHIAIDLMLEDFDMTQGVRAATLALTHSPDQRHELSFLVKKHPTLMDDEWFQEVFAAVNESGDLSLY